MALKLYFISFVIVFGLHCNFICFHCSIQNVKLLFTVKPLQYRHLLHTWWQLNDDDDDDDDDDDSCLFYSLICGTMN